MDISFIIPVYHEEKNISKVLLEISKQVKNSYEALVVYDTLDDPTVTQVKKYQSVHPQEFVRLIKNGKGFKKGVINAIKTGLVKAKGKAVVMVMADLSDDISQISVMFELLKKGNDIVCASRFMKNGKKIGGPFLKTLLARIACWTLYHIVKIPTHDATNAYKMYKRNIFKDITIESRGGFEYSLEIVVKAYNKGYKIAEIPTIWKDRTNGKSNFKLRKWLYQYLRWYMYAFRLLINRR